MEYTTDTDNKTGINIEREEKNTKCRIGLCAKYFMFSKDG